MTYARARLWLGISGVGLLVSLSALALVLNLEVPSLLTLLGLYLLVHLPLDFLGGYWLPVRFSRWPGGSFWPRYLRGALLHAALLLLFGWAILRVGERGGLLAVLALQTLLMVVLIAWQDRFAGWISGPAPRDAGFTGGIAGLPGLERVLLPAQAKLRNYMVQRRRACIETGSRTRGLLVAMGWNLAGFAASAQWPGAGVASAGELLRTMFAFTLWSFLGLLILPTASRRGVLEVDHAARQRGTTPEEFVQAIQALDRLQDDEPQRTAGVEAIFHPIPSVENRVAGWGRPVAPVGAWNAARYALYLSWPFVGLLSRAVHCNVGRPDLWVFLPTD